MNLIPSKKCMIARRKKRILKDSGPVVPKKKLNIIMESYNCHQVLINANINSIPSTILHSLCSIVCETLNKIDFYLFRNELFSDFWHWNVSYFLLFSNHYSQNWDWLHPYSFDYAISSFLFGVYMEILPEGHAWVHLPM